MRERFGRIIPGLRWGKTLNLPRREPKKRGASRILLKRRLATFAPVKFRKHGLKTGQTSKTGKISGCWRPSFIAKKRRQKWSKQIQKQKKRSLKICKEHAEKTKTRNLILLLVPFVNSLDMNKRVISGVQNRKGMNNLFYPCPRIVEVCMNTRWVDIKTKTMARLR